MIIKSTLSQLCRAIYYILASFANNLLIDFNMREVRNDYIVRLQINYKTSYAQSENRASLLKISWKFIFFYEVYDTERLINFLIFGIR